MNVISKDATVKDDDYYAKFGEIYFAYTPFSFISPVFIFLLGLIFALLENDEVVKRIIIGMKKLTNQKSDDWKIPRWLNGRWDIVGIQLTIRGHC